MSQHVLELKKISITFPGVKALDEVDFDLKSGQVHALIGANGAGKSTLMKVLAGANTHYSGSIVLDGQDVEIQAPKQAQQLGIQMVYQEVDTALISYLTVAENVMMPKIIHQMKKKHWIAWRNLHQQTKDILDSIGLHISTKALVSDLSLAEKQMILIARALATDCRFLLLDEPTAPLSQTETKQLFGVVRELKQRGVGIVFISHRLPEVFEICDEITVMRNAKHVYVSMTKNTNEQEIVWYMLGKRLDEQFPRYRHKNQGLGMEVVGLSARNILKDIHFTVNKGEIVGIAGLVGAGKTELCKALFGESKTTGQIRLADKVQNIQSSADAVKAKLALIPEERRKEGILIQESVVHNLTLPHLGAWTSRFSFLKPKKELEAAHQMIDSLGIKTPHALTKAEHLSGGNQQKIVIGKWLLADCDVYIFDEPTKGVDVGAKKDIFDLIVNLAKRGKMILYASAELHEVLGIAERVYVMYDGKIVKELKTDETSENEVLYYSVGGNQDEYEPATSEI